MQMLYILTEIQIKLKSETSYSIQPTYTFRSLDMPIFDLIFIAPSICQPPTSTIQTHFKFSCSTLEFQPYLKQANYNQFSIGDTVFLSVITLTGQLSTRHSALVSNSSFIQANTDSQLIFFIRDGGDNQIESLCSINAIQIVTDVKIELKKAEFTNYCILTVSIIIPSFSEVISIQASSFGVDIGKIQQLVVYGGENHKIIDLVVGIFFIVISLSLFAWFVVKKIVIALK